MAETRKVLTDYARSRCDASFRKLVASHVDLVYSTALRVTTGNGQLARQVSENVFRDLAGRNLAEKPGARLQTWLHRRTCSIARKLRTSAEPKLNQKRQAAIELQTIEDYTEENLARILSFLDESIDKLGRTERLAIVLRFFEQFEFGELGDALGTSEEHARKDVSRALEKMCRRMRQKGMGLSVAGLSFVLGTKAVAIAPADLALKISQTALGYRSGARAALIMAKDACCTRLNVGILTAAAVLGLIFLLIPSHKGAVPTLQQGTGKPADFADLSTEESPESVAVIASGEAVTPKVALIRETAAVQSSTPPAQHRTPVVPLVKSSPAPQVEPGLTIQTNHAMPTIASVPVGSVGTPQPWPPIAPNPGWSPWQQQQLGYPTYVSSHPADRANPNTSTGNSGGAKAIVPAIPPGMSGSFAQPGAVQGTPPTTPLNLPSTYGAKANQSRGKQRQR